MKYLFSIANIFLLFLFISCNSDSKLVKNAAKPVQQAPASKPVAQKPAYEGSVHFTLDHTEAKQGDQVCSDVKVNSFSDVISMQYTIGWDHTVLDFVAVQGFKLPYLNKQNFGIPHSRNGRLTVVWIDNSLKGVNLEDGSTIYQICFNAIGKPGSKSPLVFRESPTPFESVSASEKLFEVITSNGSITIE